MERLNGHIQQEAMIDSSPAIGSDGTIYVGSDDYNLYAINSNGTLKWSYATGSWYNSSPAIGSDSTIYVGSDDGKLYAIGSGSGVQEETGLPKECGLIECFPNPFIKSTTIYYYVPDYTNIRLTIHDISGRLVKTLCLRHSGKRLLYD